MWPYASSRVILPARAPMWASTIAAGPAMRDFTGMKRAREDEVGGEEEYGMPPAKRMMNNRVGELWLGEELEEEEIFEEDLEEDLEEEDEEDVEEDANEDAEDDAEDDVEGDEDEYAEGDAEGIVEEYVEEDVEGDVEGDVDGDVEEDGEEEDDDGEDFNQEYEQEDGDESWDEVKEVMLDRFLPGNPQMHCPCVFCPFRYEKVAWGEVELQARVRPYESMMEKRRREMRTPYTDCYTCGERIYQDQRYDWAAGQCNECRLGEMMEESERRLFDPPDYNWPCTIEELKESYL